MEQDRNKKLVMIAVLVAVLNLTIGFAAFSNTLNIASNASVSPNSGTFSVKFSTKQDSLDEGAVKTSATSTGITGTDGVIDNSGAPTLTNLSTTFTTPGQYVEYTVYARNEGKYKAYLNNINFVGEKTCTPGEGATASLVEAACQSINMTVQVGDQTYTTTTPISGHVLEPNTGEKVVVRLSYDASGTRADGSFSIKFSDVTMVYSTIDDSTYVPPVPSVSDNVKTLNSIMKSAAQSDEGVDFSAAPVAGVYTVNSTIDDENPIYYYRGAVTTNNVLFANKCWKVVRTTETGGVKLIYNGTPTDGQCLGTNPTIGNSKFNENNTTANDVRYIYANGTDSTIKYFIDTWYESNLVDYTSKLEDIPWCMDLSVSSTSDSIIEYGARGRNVYKPIEPSVTCPVEYQLKVSTAKPGLKLKYPIALLTADEITLAGSGYYGYSSDTYLNFGSFWWTLSPHMYASFAYAFCVNSDGRLNYSSSNHGDVVNVHSVRPSISLAPNTEITDSGDGTKEHPYVVE